VDRTATLSIILMDSVKHALQDIMPPVLVAVSSRMYVIPLVPPVTLQMGCVKLVRTPPHIMSIPMGAVQQNVLVDRFAQRVISKLVSALHVQLALV